MMSLAFLCLVAAVPDGDTIRCETGERVRLLGIDAPEMHGCPRNRVCAPGDGQASRQSLRGAINGRVQVQPVTRDRYGRTVAIVTSGDVNLSCYQLDQGAAIYKPKWDNGGRIARACPEVAR